MKLRCPDCKKESIVASEFVAVVMGVPEGTEIIETPCPDCVNDNAYYDKDGKQIFKETTTEEVTKRKGNK